MLNKEHTGKVIRKNMIRLGMTYEELASLVELTTSRVIYDWVDGIKLPSIKRLIMLSNVFNISIDDMLK
ncbi:helix-turn-helix transcriptional regulator [Mycoplasmatota bacterium WC44]